PFKLENGQFYYLTSFDIEIQETATVNSTSTTGGNKRAVSHSVLSNGQWFKFSVTNDGLYKLDKKALTAAGINITSIDPRTLKVYGNQGGMLSEINAEFRHDDLPELSISVIGENDGVFNDDD